MRLGDVPDMKIPDDQKERVMHAALEIGAGVVMISDAMGDTIVPLGGNAQVWLDFDDVADTTKKFDAPSVGSKVVFPQYDAFWECQVRHVDRRLRHPVDVQLHAEASLRRA